MSAQPVTTHQAHSGPAEASPVDGETHEATVRTPEEFLKYHEFDIYESKRSWHTAEAGLEELNSDRFVSEIYRGLCETTREPAASVITRSYTRGQCTEKERRIINPSLPNARQFARDYSNYAAVALRYLSEPKSEPAGSQVIAIQRTMLANLPYLPGRVVLNTISHVDLIPFFTSTINLMQDANETSGKVLVAFCQQIADQPDFLGQAEAYFLQQGTAQSSSMEAAKELKKMIAIDWHNPNPNNSVLKTFCEELIQDPHFLGEAFLQAVAQAETNQKQLGDIRRLATYALRAAKMEISDEAIAGHLRAHITDPEFTEEGLPQAYAAFVQKRIAEVQRVFAAIAGRVEYGDIRMRRNQADLEHASGKFEGYFDRAGRKKRGSRARPERPPAPDLIVGNPKKRPPKDPADAEAPAKPPEEPEREAQPERKLFIVTNNITEGLSFTEKTAEEIVKKAGVGNSRKALRDDLIDMVKMIVSCKDFEELDLHRITNYRYSPVLYQGEKYYLESFAPNRARFESKSDESFRWRIVFMVTNDGNIGITDILHHRDFDKKYS